MNNDAERKLTEKERSLYEKALIAKFLFMKDKNEHEKTIMSSFKKNMIYELLIIFVCIFLSLSLLMYSGDIPKSSDADNCMFNGNYIHCSNREHSISKSELDKFGYELKNGESILLYFDEQDNLVNVIPEDVHNKMASDFIFGKFLMVSIIIVVTMFAINHVRNTVGKEYYQFKREVYSQTYDTEN